MADADALRDAGVGGLPGTPEPQPQSAPPAAPPADETVMSLVDHLGELRTRVFRSLIAVGIGSAIGLLRVPIRDFLIQPLPNKQVQVLGARRRVLHPDQDRDRRRDHPGDAVILLYQVWAFVAPGLTPSERKMIRPWIPIALLFFALGVVDRLRRPAVRGRVPPELHRRHPRPGHRRPARTSTS